MDFHGSMLYENGPNLVSFLRVLAEAEFDRFENSQLTTEQHNWYGSFITRPYSPGASVLMCPEVYGR